ncbi:hypothetical protein [Halobellus sp. EA9]
MLETTRTYRAKIVNHSQVSDDIGEGDGPGAVFAVELPAGS